MSYRNENVMSGPNQQQCGARNHLGVPQGLVLDPIVFTLYELFGQNILNADDSVIYCCAPTPANFLMKILVIMNNSKLCVF